MAITTGGYAGQMTEAQWAVAASGLPPCVLDQTSLAVTAVANARQVSVATGTALGRGLSIVNDAAATLTLAPPSSGGQWFLVVLRRTYSSGSGGSTLIALAGPTTDGTVPTATPNTPPASLSRNVGVIEDQPLAWVHVRAADTTLTLFDVRVMAAGDGAITALNWWGAILYNGLGFLKQGGRVAIAAFVTKSNGTHQRSLWQRSNTGLLEAVGLIKYSNAGVSAGRSVLADLYDVAVNGYGSTLGLLGNQTEGVDENGTHWQWGSNQGQAGWQLVPGANTACVKTYANPTTDLALGASAWTLLNFDTVEFDPLGWSPNAAGITPPVTGRYLVSLRASFTNDDVGTRYMLRVTNNYTSEFWVGQVGVQAQTPMNLSAELLLVAGNPYYASVYRASSGGQWQRRGGAPDQTRWSIRYLGPA